MSNTARDKRTGTICILCCEMRVPCLLRMHLKLTPRHWAFGSKQIWILVCQETAKISEVKVVGQNKNHKTGQIRIRCTQGTADLADSFFDPQLWPLIFLQPLGQNKYLVHILKDLIHISLETEVQGRGMTFNSVILAQSN